MPSVNFQLHKLLSMSIHFPSIHKVLTAMLAVRGEFTAFSTAKKSYKTKASQVSCCINCSSFAPLSLSLLTRLYRDPCLCLSIVLDFMQQNLWQEYQKVLVVESKCWWYLVCFSLSRLHVPCCCTSLFLCGIVICFHIPQLVYIQFVLVKQYTHTQIP